MVEHKHSEVIQKAKGSELLTGKLKTGDIQRIADTFQESYTRMRGILMGKHFGPQEYVECAEKIVAFYDRVKLHDTVEQILNSYGSINKN